MRDAELLGGEILGVLERATLEVARWQCAKSIEREEIRRGAELAVLRSGRPKRSLRQIAAQLGELAWVRPLRSLRAAHRDRFDVLDPEHRTAPATPGMTSVMRDRGVANAALTCGTDRRDAVVRAQSRAQTLFGDRACISAHVFGRLEAHVAIVDHEHR